MMREEKSKIVICLDIYRLLLRRWKFIFCICSTVGILSIGYIVSIPRSYTSGVILLPEVSSSGGLTGNLGSLAAMAGVKVGGSEDAIYPEFYPKILSTYNFITELSGMYVTLPDTKQKATLWDYYAIHQDSPWWSKIFKSTSESPQLDQVDSYRLTKKQEKIIKEIQKSIFCKVDKKTDMISIDVTTQDAEISACVAEEVKVRLQNYITNYRTNKARIDLVYMEGITKEAKDDYLRLQKIYSDFCDTHQNLVYTSHEQEEERLEKEMQLAYSVYSQAAQQLQLAKAKVQERTPAFTTIQPAAVPIKPSAPKRMIFVAMMTMLAFLSSVIWVIIKHEKNKAKAL